jgi:carboxymethylenebutenolidase
MILATSGLTVAGGSSMRGGAWGASRDEKELVNILAGTVKLPGPGSTLQGYLARPQGGSPCAAVLLVHEERGLEEETRSRALRYARMGVVSLAVDHLSRFGGTESLGSSEAAERRVRALTNEEVVANLDAAFRFLAFHPSVRRERIGVTGAGWGTRMARAYAETNFKLRQDVVPSLV